MNDANQMEHLEKRVKDVEEIMLGTAQAPGVIHSVKQMVRDMYDQTQGFGIIHRIDAIEREKIREEAMIRGAVWVSKLWWALIGGSVVGAVIKLFKL